jgi:hypothetical protein
MVSAMREDVCIALAAHVDVVVVAAAAAAGEEPGCACVLLRVLLCVRPPALLLLLLLLLLLVHMLLLLLLLPVFRNTRAATVTSETHTALQSTPAHNKPPIISPYPCTQQHLAPKASPRG